MDDLVLLCLYTTLYVCLKRRKWRRQRRLRILLCLYTTLYVCLKRRKRRRQRRLRIQHRIRQQKQYEHFRHFRTLYWCAKNHNQEQFFKYTRMSSKTFDNLLVLVKPLLQKNKSKNPISLEERLLITLRYLSEGCSIQKLAREFYISNSTVHGVIKETCEVLWATLHTLYLKPPTEEEFVNISEEYFTTWNVPNCLGALDGKRINVQAVHHSESDSFSYKKTSIVLMATCDAYLRFSLIDIIAAESNHDGHIFSRSSFSTAVLHEKNNVLTLPKEIELPQTNVTLPYFFVADEVLPLHVRIMRPFPQNNFDNKKNIFNHRLSYACKTIKNTFGIFSNNWRLFSRNITASVENCTKYIKAAVVLQNFIQTAEMDVAPGDRHYCPTGFVDTITENEWRNENELPSIGHVGLCNATTIARRNRDLLADYFVCDVGSLP